MSTIENVLYTAKTHTPGGRDGASRSADGRPEVTPSSPGTAGTGFNPEHLSDKLRAIGTHVTRYGLVVVLLWIGGMKFTAYEAEGI